MISEEKATSLGEKAKRKKDLQEVADRLGWRDVNTSEECFILSEIRPEDHWATLKLRNSGTNLFQIFNSFVTDSLVDKIVTRYNDENHTFGTSKTHINHKRYYVRKKHIWQAFAVQLYIIGRQERPVEVRKNVNFKRIKIEEARSYFQSKHEVKPVGRELIESLIAHAHITSDDTEELSKNFQSIVHKLGQSIAGDEKLFFFSGNSGDIRLVVSKPGKVGLWFFELCCMLRVGDKELPYLLHFKLAKSQSNENTIDKIVQSWVDVTKSIGQDLVAPEELPNPDTYLAADSYYMSKASRDILVKSGQRFLMSCKEDRVKVEVARVHNDDQPDKPGLSRTIYNDQTRELFTYHYDTQKGVGKKYNLSRGLIRSTRRDKILLHKNRVPGYTYYKTMFEVCDKFNRNLHDRAWPLKRGGKKIPGDLGCQHDFSMAAIIQNTIYAYLVITCKNPDNHEFESLILTLANEVYYQSL